MATVFPVKAPRIDFGIEPDFKDCLCEWAFRTRVVNSGELRSAIDNRWRGANGDVSGLEGVEAAEYDL